MEKTKLLEIKNLVTEFRTEGKVLKAVNDVSFTLNRGETIGIVGESGSGKSVTSLSVMRLIPNPPGTISGGELLFHTDTRGTIDLLKLSEKEMRAIRGNDIAMIFQEPMTSLNPVFTCGDQVMEAILLHQKVTKKEAKEKTIALFKTVQLPRPEAIFSSYPHQISGGQKQRVMIAMAMSCNPSILIADEPTTALDVTVQQTILDLMLKLQQENDMGILFITHDLGVIAELADKVVVMYKGRIVEQGPVMEIFENPKHPYTKGLLACRPPLDVRLKRLPVVSDFMEVNNEGTIIEKDLSIADVTKNAIQSDAERKADHDRLYAQKPVLSIRNLKTYFPMKADFFGRTKDWVKAVDDVSFVVYPGETLGLVGESGCGKTTLGRSILRLQEPSSGKVIYDGKDLHSHGCTELRALRKDVQIIFQDPYSSLNPRMPIGAAIQEPMTVHNIHANEQERKQQTLQLLERVGLHADHYDRYPHEFSRWAAPTDLHCAGFGGEAQVHHLRRIGVGLGCVGAGAGAQPALGFAPRLQPHVYLHQPRPECGQVHERPHGGDEPRQGGRDGRCRPDLFQPADGIHQETHRSHPKGKNGGHHGLRQGQAGMEEGVGLSASIR
jgi:peptide/nickel transport system ATP-binding protein